MLLLYFMLIVSSFLICPFIRPFIKKLLESRHPYCNEVLRLNIRRIVDLENF